MAEQALYRKYRSADFSEVIGQDHVVKTLTTAISSGRLSHAYLFTGPRGTGKTSVARLLARALNCTGEQKPCNNCRLCQAAINSSLDVVEIDAASNRSIDAVRELREKVSLAPAVGKYKIYIVDEVHMLTTEAFNALLKTLEEPPAHVVFVLATTEAHKLPETIVSRTQRFAFKPIGQADLIAGLGKIAAGEQLEIEPAALEIIATMARGGFRDAISMLDQVAAGGEQPVTAGTVRALLGLSDTEAVAAVSQAVAASDAKAAVEGLSGLFEQGAQPGQVAVQLAGQWREALLAGVGLASADPAATALAGQLTSRQLSAGVEAFLEVTRSPWPREALELAVVRLATSEPASAAPPPASEEPAKTQRAKPAAPADTAAATTASAPADADGTAELWPKVLVALRRSHAPLAAAIYRYPVDTNGDTITIKSPYNYHRDLVLKAQNRRVIEDVASKTLGRTVSVTAVTDETTQKTLQKTTADPNSELVSSALEILGGEVVD